MNGGKPDNLLRKSLTVVGLALFRVGLAKAVIRLSSGRVRALLYHAVEEHSDSFTKGLEVSVTPAEFAANLDYFQRYYNVIPVSQIGRAPLPPRALIITFDDGYSSVYRHAVPALRSRGLSACVYLISRSVKGQLVWVNRLNHALREHPTETRQALQAFDDLACLVDAAAILGHVQHHYTPAQIEAVCEAIQQSVPEPESHELYVSTDDIRDMQAQGIEFGFHTRDHYNLSNCNEAELLQQLDGSDIEHLTDTNTFAYPFGNFSEDAVRLTTRQGYTRIMTVGNNNRRFSPIHMDRTEVFTRSPARLFAQLEVVEPVVGWLRSWMLGSESEQDERPLPGKSACPSGSPVNKAANNSPAK